MAHDYPLVIKHSNGESRVKAGLHEKQHLSHMLHGAGIFTNICPKNHPVM